MGDFCSPWQNLHRYIFSCSLNPGIFHLPFGICKICDFFLPKLKDIKVLLNKEFFVHLRRELLYRFLELFKRPCAAVAWVTTLDYPNGLFSNRELKVIHLIYSQGKNGFPINII